MNIILNDNNKFRDFILSHKAKTSGKSKSKIATVNMKYIRDYIMFRAMKFQLDNLSLRNIYTSENKGKKMLPLYIHGSSLVANDYILLSSVLFL